MQIIPTILTTNLEKAQTKLKKYQDIFDWIQLDIMDGFFVANRTLLPGQFSNLANLASFKIDVHLMVDNPLAFLGNCQKANASRIIGHIELMPDQAVFATRVKGAGLQAGLAIDLPTPLDNLDHNLLTELDVILLMSVKAGWGGQKFSRQVLEKIKKLAKIKKEKNLPFSIALDGGINTKTIKQPFREGAEIFYIGNYLFENPEEKLAELKKVLR